MEMGFTDQKIWTIILSVVRNGRAKLLILVFFSLASTILGLLNPWLSACLINVFQFKEKPELFLVIVGLMVVVNVAGVVFSYFQSKWNAQLQIALSSDMIARQIGHLEKVSSLILEKMDSAKINQQLNQDANELTTFSISLFTSVPIMVVNLVVSGIMLLQISGWMVISCLIAFFVYSFLLKRNANVLKQSNERVIESQTEYFSSFFEWLQHWPLSKFYSTQILKKKALDSQNQLEKAAISQINVQYRLSALSETVFFLPQLILLIAGGFSVIDGKLTLGFFVAGLSYLQTMIASFQSVSDLSENWQNERAVFKRWQSFSQIEEEKTHQKKDQKDALPSEITIFIDRFSYPESSDELFKNFSLKLKVGKIYCIKGANGTGKSTLLKLISGFYPFPQVCPVSSLDNSMDLGEKEEISFLFQEPMYLNGWNANENIHLGSDFPQKIPLWEEEIESFAQKAERTEYSIGQLQKIALNRCFVQNRKIILLDEPTNHLDTEAQKDLMKYLNEIKVNHYILIASHSEMICKEADELIEIDEPAKSLSER